MSVLVINSGSSSIKYQLVNPESGEAIAHGLVERIGEETGHIEHVYRDITREIDGPVPDHGKGLEEVLRLCDEVGPSLTDSSIKAVGHRIVQGGKYFDGPAIVTDDVQATIEKLCPLGPLHNPAHLKGIIVARRLLPDVPHVAVFDTAFFQGLPGEAATYAIDRALAEKYEIRRYGAHGTSHQFVSSEVSKLLGRDDLKQIVLHLGNGASASAVVNNKAVETSMGLTPLEGLVMGGRTGDIDPAVVFHLARVADMSIDELDDLFNRQSGLKGLAGDNDMRAVRELAESGDANAIEALAVYAHRIVKYIGSYSAIMGGLDAITFTAGVGENDAELRREVIERLNPFGIFLDEEKNKVRSKEPRIISTPESKVAVLVFPTNEELAIARQAMTLV
ncbi:MULTISPECIES: acetate kinase [unclassified Actinobaculum]|uniref:acetate/propionate family kinase n=1 Tax=unclassified Actinobaculum TaxID=2609299 RepID=UPI000D527C44|nr:MULTISPECIES: acetate kinase [unclassified Actinobaculum]AWE42079.1 acetate kinase [Actinobaculum sp. 313]RTE50632.1 acetate kinase [Actinobaculum sp. 352]